MPVKNRFAEMLPEIAGWRQDFHRHPELMYDLPRTSARVAGLLRDFGVDEVVEGIGRTGVVAVIRGRGQGQQGTGAGRTLGLRADMDALPIIERTGLDHASQTPGVMHACGHDGHTAMLLGAAKYLAETRAFDGTVVCIFQPAEEGGAGAKAMIDDGLMDRFGIDEVYGLHNAPGLPVGQFATRSGPLQASADEFRITVTAEGRPCGRTAPRGRYHAGGLPDRRVAAICRGAQCRPAGRGRRDRGHLPHRQRCVEHHRAAGGDGGDGALP
jgi:amidohydrolase